MVEAPRPRLVVAEDDEAVLELVRIRLELASFDVSYARDGYAALETIRSVQPAGVILDLNMPRLDGIGVLKALPQLKLRATPPVLVLTARNAPEDVRLCLSLGAKDVLAKPFNDRELIARAARLLRRRPVKAAASPPKPPDHLMI
jgi:DNA-binding response OmpR family regulator